MNKTMKDGADSESDCQWHTSDEEDSGGEANGALSSTSALTFSQRSSPPRRNAYETSPSQNHSIGANIDVACSSRSNVVRHFMAMGFSEKMVERAVEENGEENEDAVLEALLTYKALENSPSRSDRPSSDSPTKDESEEDTSDEPWETDGISNEESKEDEVLSTLVDMGFGVDEASAAIQRCGVDASVFELSDSIRAGQMAEEYDAKIMQRAGLQKRKWSDVSMQSKSCRGRVPHHRKDICGDDGPLISLPNPMVGFGLPNQSTAIRQRKLPEAALGPPYFFYENVALAPKGVWDTISRFLYDVEPEFVDSKHFCAAARKRGYVHNLPINGRLPLLPLPPKTINEALPHTARWWPRWDERQQLNCLQTCIASAKLLDRIRKALVNAERNSHGSDPPLSVQRYVIGESKKWNLVWVGRNKVAPLEPDEMELLLGFPRDHTRGISRTERYRSLGNSFQVDTVAYQLSPLRNLFPNGVNVLSLFSGIGGAEVALYRLGIRLKTVVSIEKSEINRNVIRSWWETTGQTGRLIEFEDVQDAHGDRLEQLIRQHGRFDLVIGGSPCNNLAGSNRYSRDGLEGEQSQLFFDYVRILDLVKTIQGRA